MERSIATTDLVFCNSYSEPTLFGEIFNRGLERAESVTTLHVTLWFTVRFSVL